MRWLPAMICRPRMIHRGSASVALEIAIELASLGEVIAAVDETDAEDVREERQRAWVCPARDEPRELVDLSIDGLGDAARPPSFAVRAMTPKGPFLASPPTCRGEHSFSVVALFYEL